MALMVAKVANPWARPDKWHEIEDLLGRRQKTGGVERRK